MDACKRDHQAEFSFYGRLQQLAAARLTYPFDGEPAIKDPIEALGVPHTEVELLVVNGNPVSFDYRLRDADQVAVYPFGTEHPAAAAACLIPEPQKPIRFILDVHLGKLARRLRMLGIDCLYRNDFRDARIIDLALQQQRVILTRDRGILKHARVKYGYLVATERVERQLEEVLQRYPLIEQLAPLSRCPRCNGLLREVSKQQVRELLQPKTDSHYQVFKQCPDCHKVYWRGAHFAGISRWLKQLTEIDL